jgi:uncharacterized protein (TIGR02285 family)
MFTFFATAYATEKETLYWLTDDNDDSDKLFRPTTESLSVADDTIRLLMERLSQYNFQHKFAHNPSIERLLKKIPNSCAPNRLKTPERIKNYLYSLPINLYLGLHLYYKKSEVLPLLLPSMLNDKGKLIDLSTLFLHNHEYILGIDKGRSFGEFLDNQITDLDNHNIIIRQGGMRSTSVAHMLFRDRINYIIDYPVSIKIALNSFPKDVPLESVEIADMPDYILGYIACNNNALGKQVITDINKALLNLYKTENFYKAHIRYLSEADLSDFNRAYEKAFKSKVPVKTKP